MAITTFAALEHAASQARTYVSQKTISTISGSGVNSCWRVGSFPVAAAIPTTTVLCTNATPGAVAIVNAPPGQNNYLVETSCGMSATTASILICDRLLQMGGLSGTVTTAQTVAMDASVVELDGRRGSADYSDLEWWMEWYTTTGSTVVTANIAVTYTDTTTTTLSVSISASSAANGLKQIYPVAGKYIKSVDSVTLSATTGTAGNFGITVSRPITQMAPRVNETLVGNWSKTAIQRIPTDACLWFLNFNSSGSASGYYTLRIAAA